MECVFLLFIIYSFLGWLLEVLDFRIEDKKWINRGFLMGPICPIYGVTCFFISWLLQKYLNDPIVLFIMSIVICAIVEYTTSFLLEKIFNLRWWDYSNKKFNINGRICLETMLPFGLLCLIMMYFINPFLQKIIFHIPTNIIYILDIVFLTLLIIDILISFNVVINIKNVTKNIRKDSTEDITRAVKRFVDKNFHLHTRLLNAFPHIRKIIINNLLFFLIKCFIFNLISVKFIIPPRIINKINK